MKTIIALTLTAACGGTGGDHPDAPSDPALRYEPWRVGAAWSYKLTDAKDPAISASDRLTTIMGEQDVGGSHAGTRAFLTHIVQLYGSKDVFQAYLGDLDVRYRSVFYDAQGVMTSTDVDDPYRLKLDESFAHTKPNAQWSQSFTETTTGGTPSHKTETWKVIANDEQITVIAGTYTALHIQRTSSGGAVQDYWYARGVGKLKETGGAQLEELISFTPGN